MNVNLILLWLGSFALGSVPFGYIVARIHGIDIRAVGSGNIGATNVKRALGTKWGLFVFVLDVVKGAAPGWVARAVVDSPLGAVDAQVVWFSCGFFAVLGHIFSPFLHFRGGKGIATALGMVVGAAPLVAAGAFGVFLVLLPLTGFVSLSSIVAVFTSILFGAFLPGQSPQLVPAYGVVWLLVLVTHRKNIVRLLQGTESKFSLSGKAEALTKPEVVDG